MIEIKTKIWYINIILENKESKDYLRFVVYKKMSSNNERLSEQEIDEEVYRESCKFIPLSDPDRFDYIAYIEMVTLEEDSISYEKTKEKLEDVIKVGLDKSLNSIMKDYKYQNDKDIILTTLFPNIIKNIKSLLSDRYTLGDYMVSTSKKY